MSAQDFDVVVVGGGGVGSAAAWQLARRGRQVALLEQFERWPGIRFDTRALFHPDSGSYRARAVVAAVNAWATKLVGKTVPLPPLRVTQEQPAHFRALGPEDTWPSFGHLLDGAYGGIYGLATPGEGIKVGFHGVGPEVDPDQRDYTTTPDTNFVLDRIDPALRRQPLNPEDLP